MTTMNEVIKDLNAVFSDEVGQVAVSAFSGCLLAMEGKTGMFCLPDLSSGRTDLKVAMSAWSKDITDENGEPLSLDAVRAFVNEVISIMKYRGHSRHRFAMVINLFENERVSYVWEINESGLVVAHDGFFIYEDEFHEGITGMVLKDGLMTMWTPPVRLFSVPALEMKEREAALSRAEDTAEVFFKKITAELPDGIHKVSIVSPAVGVSAYQFLKEGSNIYAPQSENGVEGILGSLRDFFLMGRVFALLLRSTAVPFPVAYLDSAKTSEVNSLKSDLAMWMYDDGEVFPKTAQETKDFICVTDDGFSEAPDVFHFVDAWPIR